MNRYFHALFAPEGDPASGGGNPQDPGAPSTPPKSDDPGDPKPDDLKSSLHAARRREAEAAKRAEEAEARLAKLEEAEKKRKEAQMSELDKANARIAELEEQTKTLSADSEALKAIRERQESDVEAAMKDLPEEDQGYVKALPLDQRMGMINRLKAATTQKAPIPGGKGPVNGLPTKEEVLEMRAKGDPRWREFWAKLRLS